MGKTFSCEFVTSMQTRKMTFYHIEISEHDRELIIISHVFSKPVANEDQALDGGLILRVPVSRKELLAWKYYYNVNDTGKKH